MHLIGKPNSDFTFQSEMAMRGIYGQAQLINSQSTPQLIMGPLLARAPGLQPCLAQWLIRLCIEPVIQSHS